MAGALSLAGQKYDPLSRQKDSSDNVTQLVEFNSNTKNLTPQAGHKRWQNRIIRIQEPKITVHFCLRRSIISP